MLFFNRKGGDIILTIDIVSRIYAYIRVSSKEQNLDRQLEAVSKYVTDPRNIIIDKQSGKDFQRVGYQTLKTQLLRSGDTLYIKELDRLGRDYEQIKQEYADLLDRGVNVVIIDMPMLSTADKSDLERSLIRNIVFEITAYVAEKERLKNRMRCEEGIRLAKEKGVRFGRPKVPKPANWDSVYSQWKNGEITAVKGMELTGLKRNIFYKFVHEEEE